MFLHIIYISIEENDDNIKQSNSNDIELSKLMNSYEEKISSLNMNIDEQNHSIKGREFFILYLLNFKFKFLRKILEILKENEKLFKINVSNELIIKKLNTNIEKLDNSIQGKYL